jgi:hypothetical protein
MLVYCLALFNPEDKAYVPLKCWFTFIRLYGIISQKIELFIATAVRTSNPTKTSYQML